MSAPEVVVDAIRKTLKEKNAKRVGNQNITLTNSVFATPLVSHDDFYQICVTVAKEVLDEPYVASIEKGLFRSTVIIQFVHKLSTNMYAFPASGQAETSSA